MIDAAPGWPYILARQTMNGVHDMGGMHGVGPVERDEVTFRAQWETRMHPG